MHSELIKIMKKTNITQKQIAELLNIRQATVSDKVQGKSQFNFEEALKIKKVFFPEYDLEYLFSKE